MHLFVFSFDPTWPSGGAKDLMVVRPAEDFIGPDGQVVPDLLHQLTSDTRLRDCIQLRQVNARGLPCFLEQWLTSTRAPAVHTGKWAQLFHPSGGAVTAYQRCAPNG